MRMKRNWATLAGLVKELRAHTFYWPPYQARYWLSFAIGRHDIVTSYPDLTAERKLRHFKTRIFFLFTRLHHVESEEFDELLSYIFFLYCTVQFLHSLHVEATLYNRSTTRTTTCIQPMTCNCIIKVQQIHWQHNKDATDGTFPQSASSGFVVRCMLPSFVTAVRPYHTRLYSTRVILHSLLRYAL